jgi:predicted TIM-barrel fold metal-dependent hydrolase
MIVDCYTHTWETPEQLGRCLPANGKHPRLQAGAPDPAAPNPARHLAAAEPVDTTIVLGFKSRYLEAEIPNHQIATYVNQYPQRLIGFAGIDPSDPKEAVADMHHARDELAMRGIAVAPAAQDFHPTNSQAMQVYAEIAAAGLPLLFHTGVHISPAAKLEYAQPVLLDEVAREFPNLNIIIAHLGYPWVNEALVLLAKHANVYAEISWLLDQPWQAYQALLNAYQYGVTDKLLFGSGFPRTSASQCIEELYGISHLVHGTNLPTIPREHLRGIVERDALSLLGIAVPKHEPPLQPAAQIPTSEQ